MRALVLDDRGVAMRDIAEPVPAAGESLVRVQMAGVCNTDVEIAKGYMGFSGVLGHELYGVVESSSNPALVGKRVAGEINHACGRCATCGAGLGRHCPERCVMGIVGKDGCFAEHVTVKDDNLHVLPDTLDDTLACFVEPTAAAFEVLEQVSVRARDRVLVLGDGKLGLLVAQVLSSVGCEPVVVGRHARKLELAGRHGARPAELSSLARKSFDVVVEATGSPAGMEAAIALTRPRGTLVLKSTYHGAVQLDAAPIVIDELTLVGSRCGPFEPAIAALASGQVDPSGMVDAVVPLADAAEALERATRPGVMKVLLDMR